MSLFNLNNIRLNSFFLIILLLPLSAVMAQSGDVLDYSKDSHFGAVDLEAGFSGDPRIVEISAGGSVDVDYLNNSCTGYASSSPDYKLNWTGSSSLRIFFIADDGSDDTTIIVNDPNGNWNCNDDYGSGYNPMVEFNQSSNGRYDIWVGTYGDQDSYVSGNLYITELDYSPDDYSGSSSSSYSSSGLDYSLDPIYGVINLNNSLLAKSHSVSLGGGGGVSVDDLDLGTNCTGYASEAPDYRVNWSGSTSGVNISFNANNSSDDAVLIVNTPDGEWICNDDGPDGYNPRLTLGSSSEGQFDIWVANYDGEDIIQGNLVISR